MNWSYGGQRSGGAQDISTRPQRAGAAMIRAAGEWVRFGSRRRETHPFSRVDATRVKI